MHWYRVGSAMLLGIGLLLGLDDVVKSARLPLASSLLLCQGLPSSCSGTHFDSSDVCKDASTGLECPSCQVSQHQCYEPCYGGLPLVEYNPNGSPGNAIAVGNCSDRGYKTNTHICTAGCPCAMGTLVQSGLRCDHALSQKYGKECSAAHLDSKESMQ